MITVFLVFLVSNLFTLLVVGLIRPRLVLIKISNPTRLKVVGLWFFAMMVLMFIWLASVETASPVDDVPVQAINYRKMK